MLIDISASYIHPNCQIKKPGVFSKYRDSHIEVCVTLIIGFFFSRTALLQHLIMTFGNLYIFICFISCASSAWPWGGGRELRQQAEWMHSWGAATLLLCPQGSGYQNRKSGFVGGCIEMLTVLINTLMVARSDYSGRKQAAITPIQGTAEQLGLLMNGS